MMAVLQAAVARWLGPPRSPALETLWADFAAEADEYDVVFIGTSRVQRHIDPLVFDRALAERGLAARSYNLGLPKMSALEGAHLIERLRQRRPRRLKLVVLEPTLYFYDAENWATDRALALHDWPGTCLAVRLAWASEGRRQAGIGRQLRAITPHLLSFACRTAGLRRGDRFFRPQTSPPHMAAAGVSRDEKRRGFSPLPVVEPSLKADDWRQRFRGFMATAVDWTGTQLSSEEVFYFEDVIQHIRQAGARPVFLLGPKVKRDSHTAAVYTTHQRKLRDVALIDHLRSHSDPALYDLSLWHDFDHLNAAGAAMFSRRLALQLEPLLH